MILTCPACDTKYVVKDGAIPDGGRQVRCAACKHSWQQMPEPADDVMTPDLPEGESSDAAGVDQVTPHNEAMLAPSPPPIDAEATPLDDHQPEISDDLAPPLAPDSASTAAEDDYAFDGFDDADDERPRSKLWRVMILVLLVAVLAVAAWYLAPASMRARMGLAQGNQSPLELMLTTSDRQQLASGNELLAISGRVINPTDVAQAVPPIHAELRNKGSKALVYRWTIAPPARILPPGGSASFNSAEVDIPRGGDELTVTLGGRAAS